MAVKKTNKVNITEIRKIAASKGAVIGTKEVIKNLKLGKLSKVYITSNCPSKVKKDIEYYAGAGKADVFSLDCPNDELGIICKKPYSISVMALSEGGN